MAFGGLEPEPEPDAPALPDGCSDMVVVEVSGQGVLGPGGAGARSNFDSEEARETRRCSSNLIALITDRNATITGKTLRL